MSDAPVVDPPPAPRPANAQTLTAFVLLGALLLFGVEPLVGKVLLPAYGGSFHVWTTCLTFFQGALLVGYLYCHLVAPRVGRWHLVLVLAPMACLPLALTPREAGAQPVLAIAATLALGVGVPFVALSTTSVVAQSWWVASTRGPQPVNPYPLYAASNLGSLLALLAYPFLIEPLVGLRAQRLGWSALFVLYVALALLAARGLEEPPPRPASPPVADRAGAPRTPRYGAWFLLSALPSAFLLATTNVVTLDLGALPFLWVGPLAVYLGTFVLSFRAKPWCPWLLRRFWLELSLVGVFLWGSGFLELMSPLSSFVGALVYSGLLFVVCLVAHHTLYLSRPAAEGLTGFYLLVALGGWAGGLFVTFLAPALFPGLYEYPLAIAALALTLLACRFAAFRSWARAEPWPKLGASALLLVFVPCWVAGARPAPPRATHRNVYGIYRVLEEVRTEGTLRLLTHGAIVHGSQLLEQPRMATTYYGAGSPVVDVLQSFAPPRDVGVVGLGVGTLAAHFGAGERLVFFELDPDNEAIAREHFSFLDDCAAIPTVEPGDARLNLAQAEDGRFQVLAVDAFSGDAIPVHLLTREALALYLSKLRPEGILALHVSNRFVDLRPVLLATGSTLGVEALTRSSRQSADRPLESESHWVAFSRSATARTRLRAAGWSRVAELDLPQARPWTDDHASLLGPLISAALR